MIGGIVLAAGAATRMGQQKLLLPFGGLTVVEQVVAQARGGGVSDLIVVTGADGDAVEHVLAPSGVTTVRNPDFTRGMLSSVRAGLSAAPRSWDAALLLLGDQPLVTSAIVRAVVSAHRQGADRIILPVYGGRRGHPMVLPRVFWPEALTRHDDAGLRGLLRAHGDRVCEIAVDSADILTDMDTPEDYRRALARLVERGDSAP